MDVSWGSPSSCIANSLIMSEMSLDLGSNDTPLYYSYRYLSLFIKIWNYVEYFSSKIFTFWVLALSNDMGIFVGLFDYTR